MTRPHDPDAPVLGPGVQGRQRHPRRPHLHAHLLGQARPRARALNPGNNKRRTPAASSRCTPRTASRSKRSARATSSRSSASRTRTRATRCATRTSRSSSSACTSPSPSSRMSIEPKTTDDKRKLSEALATIRREDPSFRSPTTRRPARPSSRHGRASPRDHQEQARPRHEDQRRGRQAPRVVPRGHHRKAEYVRGLFKKQSGGRGQFGDCTITSSPSPRSRPPPRNSTSPTTSPSRTRSSAARSPRSSSPRRVRHPPDRAHGREVRLPLINIKADAGRRLVPRVDSSQVAFEQAGRLALRDASRRPARSCSSRS
jgi:elongation factor G